MEASVASYGPHFGEEGPLRGRRGSGTIFFSRCNMRCCYCQNSDISQQGYGEGCEPERLAGMMLELQDIGCHNINLVSPTHVLPQILAAVLIAAQAGLAVPLVYNSGGYDALAALRLLDSVVDIYMPDMKYADDDVARAYSGVDGYPEVNQAAVAEMHRQVGDLRVNENGVATRGLLVRHLVLPGGLAGTRAVARFLARRISENTYVNVMDQYRPCYEADRHPTLARRITPDEWRAAVVEVRGAGLQRLAGRAQRWG
jgi:putative pyruvate formate lyase activating enzyme